MSRVLIWSPNYAPEPTGIPPLVTDAAEWLVRCGHAVDVVTAVPNYPERRIHPDYRGVLSRSEMRSGVRVHRSWLRARRERSFFDKALYELTISTVALPKAAQLVRRTDVVVCVVPTLLAATYAAALARTTQKRLILWVQDIVLAAGASVDSRRFALQALRQARRLERFAARSADHVIVCSPGFRDYYVDLGVSREKIDTLYNWADLDQIRPVAPHANGRVRFLYAGNIGYTQGLGTLVEAARREPGIAVEIVGAGNASDEVERIAATAANVAVRQPVSRAEYPSLLASADVHVVMQRRVSAGANLPSKIATYMASGRPIVGSIALDTPAAALLRDSGGAVLVEPESPEELLRAMRRLAEDPDLRAQLGRRAREFAEQHFAKERALRRFEELLLPCVGAAASRTRSRR